MAVSIETSEGIFTAYFSKRGLAELNFPGARANPRTTTHPGNASGAELERWRGLTANALARIFSAHNPDALPPLDWSESTQFQRDVWTALRAIRPGQTRTYSEIAAAVGKPDAARAVGIACGSNPIPVLVPCHRVVAANGKLGGFSGGLAWKRRLLALECAAIFT